MLIVVIIAFLVYTSVYTTAVKLCKTIRLETKKAATCDK